VPTRKDEQGLVQLTEHCRRILTVRRCLRSAESRNKWRLRYACVSEKIQEMLNDFMSFKR
jgi:hypothetical protein